MLISHKKEYTVGHVNSLELGPYKAINLALLFKHIWILISIFVTPHACTRGKVIGLVIIVVFMDTKITQIWISRHPSEL